MNLCLIVVFDGEFPSLSDSVIEGDFSRVILAGHVFDSDRTRLESMRVVRVAHTNPNDFSCCLTIAMH